jgi:alkanesulfonate monooxygenase SsuD/methylene tetrahydromethanopterin reductase-like flavin-dependent oxidoreductase (luciferase family)
MKRGLFVAPTIHEYADPIKLVELAKVAEAAGWEGFFICDHLLLDPEGMLGLADPTVVLGAIAWKVAKEFASLDQLSNGRVRIGVGLGGLDQEFSNFGEDPNKKLLAKKTDEGLEIIERLNRGEAVDFDGEHYQLTGARLLPSPVQQPRIPVWVAAMLPFKAGQRRAARWDGIVPQVMPMALEESQDATDQDMRVIMEPTPEHIAEVVKFTDDLRDSDKPFDIVVSGISWGLDPDAASEKLRSYECVGTTWWLEWLDCGVPGTYDRTVEQISAGPPAF